MSNLVRNFVKNTRVKKAKLEDEINPDLGGDRTTFLSELDKVTNPKSGTLHRNLRIFNNPENEIKQDLAALKKKYPTDESLSEIISKVERKLNEGAKVLSMVSSQIDKETKTAQNIQRRLESHKEQISDFVNDILSELHDVTVDFRKNKPIPPPPELESVKNPRSAPTHLVQATNLFAVFSDERNRELKKRFSKKYEDD